MQIAAVNRGQGSLTEYLTFKQRLRGDEGGSFGRVWGEVGPGRGNRSAEAPGLGREAGKEAGCVGFFGSITLSLRLPGKYRMPS